MGLKSGEYLGSGSMEWPRASSIACICGLLWNGALSMMTRLLGRSSGISTCSIHALTVWCRAAALKQHRRKPFTPTLRHDEIDVFAIIPADFSVDLLPARRPSVGTIAVFGEAAFVEINHVGAAVFLYPCAQSAQIIYSAIVMTFRVPRRFFY